MKTDVAIIGAGPSGLMLGHFLAQAGIDVVVLERRSPEYVLGRIRAGVLEQVTVNNLRALGLADRLDAEGLPHAGFDLMANGEKIHIDIKGLTGQEVVVYGQTEVTKDLMDAADKRGVQIIYEAEDVALSDLESDRPVIHFSHEGERKTLEARFIAGCDGFHGPSRTSIPDSLGRPFEKVYPFGWLGILADVPPCNDELIYANHERGFALASMRSSTRSRYYIQVPLEDSVDDWPDDAIWDELERRLGPETAPKIVRGPSIEKSIAPLRSFVYEPMRFGNLFLVGDAAHIVPPTGAKGLNLAASDVAYLSDALIRFFKKGRREGIDDYSRKALDRVWKSERFSWYLTNLTHRFPAAEPFDHKMQLAELAYIAGSESAQRTIAENYVGIPL